MRLVSWNQNKQQKCNVIPGKLAIKRLSARLWTLHMFLLLPLWRERVSVA